MTVLQRPNDNDSFTLCLEKKLIYYKSFPLQSKSMKFFISIIFQVFRLGYISPLSNSVKIRMHVYSYEEYPFVLLDKYKLNDICQHRMSH